MTSYIQCREQIYYFRYRVPVLLKPFIGKTELKVSLETGNEREAQIRSHHWLRIVDCLKQLNHRVRTCQIDSKELPNTLKQLFSSSRSHLPSSAPVSSIEPEASIPSPDIQDLVDEYTNLKIKKREWLSASLYRRLRGLETRHWIETALRRTALPFLLTAAIVSAAGWGMALYAPDAHSIGDVISYSKQSR